ncbi:hypothetical protein Aperf_G00000009962 [Anoplocephala perfoliata]
MVLTDISSSKCFEGYQKVFRHDSVSTKCPMKFGVYLPPCYGLDKPCPVVFFLQGLVADEQEFIIQSGAQRYAAKLGLILVSTDTRPRECSIPGEENRTEYGALAGCYVNATEEPFKKNYQLYDYYTKELPELIGKSFNVIRGKYGVIGYSLSYFGKWLLTDHLGADADWSMYDAVELLKKHKKRFAIPPLIDQGDADTVISSICDEQDFIVKYGAQRYASKLGLVLVNPDTRPRCEIPDAEDPNESLYGAGFYLNATQEPWNKHYQMYDYVTKELPELIEKNFNVIPGKYGLFGHSDLMPEELLKACAEVGQEINLRFQKGYDHLYLFISTFMEDHLKFHCDNLSKL